MKRILLVLAIVTLILPATRQAQAADVSVDFFYNNLNDGNWVEVGDYGYCWQPNVAVSDPNWRPYADGYWAYTDAGWTWVSYEDFGWATYHYGRWVRLADQGWVWVPGYEWGPAWVSWRTGGDYIGWAPLPPASGEVVFEGRPITTNVDVAFDIGPANFNFVDIRFIGEPVLRERIFEPSRNVTIINSTVNVTNITVNNNTVINHGPDINTVNRFSTRPIQRLTLQRETNVNFATGVRANEVTKVQGNNLVVAAPMKIQKPSQPVVPKNVKAKIAQAKVEHGWSGISDPKVKAELQQKMKTESSKSVPPPTVQPSERAAAAGGASPAEGANAPAMTPATRGAGAASASPAATAGKGKGRRGEQPKALPSPGASVAGEQEQPTPQERGRGRKGRAGEQTVPKPAPTTNEAGSPPGVERDTVRGHNQGVPRSRGETTATPRENPEKTGQGAGLTPEATEPPSKQKGRGHHEETAPTPSGAGHLSNEGAPGRHEGRNELAPSGQSTAPEMRGRRNAAEERALGQPPAVENKKAGGQQKKKGGEASPSPAPQ